MKKKYSFFMFSCIICNIFLHISSSGVRGKNCELLENRPQIVYLFFKVEKDALGMETFILEEKKITNGKLKNTDDCDENNLTEGDYMISLIGRDGKEVIKQHLEDPLNPEMEVYEDKISRKKLSLQKAEFNVRFSYTKEIAGVKIEKITLMGKRLLFNQNL